MSVGWVYHDDFAKHDTGPTHPEQPQRLIEIRHALQQSGLLQRLHAVHFDPATPEDVSCVHEPAYVSLVQRACAEGFTFIGSMETRICPASCDVAMLAVGGVLAACAQVLAGKIRRAFCAVRPPGHHAERDLAGGFCLFNNVAVAAQTLTQRDGLSRVAIVDFDVHHGNGTQEVFEDRDDVLYISLHAHPKMHFPGTGWTHEIGRGRGEGFTLNVPMPPGAGDSDYRQALADRILPRLRQFQPQFLLLSAGFDAVAVDTAGAINLQPQSFEWLTRDLVGIADQFASGRVVSVLEGGYELSCLGSSVVHHVRALL